ncbi:MAG: ComF family protein [Caldilineaceae bacterium]
MTQFVDTLFSWGRHCVNALYPAQCVECGRCGDLLCDVCAQRVLPVSTIVCFCCGRPQPSPVQFCLTCQNRTTHALQMTRAAAVFTEPLRTAIHHLKYEQKPELAQPLARYLVAVFSAAPWPQRAAAIEAVIPVPIHADRRAERGYNQAELLAGWFCRTVNLPMRAEWLSRWRATPSQVGLSAAERQRNVVDAFRVTGMVQGRTILLIDDVYTTGATLQACADELMRNGARRVYALSLAMAA